MLLINYSNFDSLDIYGNGRIMQHVLSFEKVGWDNIALSAQ